MDAMSSRLTIEMIPDGIHKAIAEEIGIGNLLKLAQLVGGTTFYVMKKDAILRPVRDIKIKEEFNGYNTNVLAKKYDVSESWVRRLCGQELYEGQQTFF